MRILGINDSSHDAAVSVVDNGEIVFAAHSERYNKQKNTFELAPELIEEALSYGNPDVVAYFERRNRKRLRRMLYGGINGEYKHLYKRKFKNSLPKEIQISHHYSHACAGYFTSPFNDATIVVLDAIGEFDTATVWHASDGVIRKKMAYKVPFSFGLFYSAFTALVGLKPGFDEYILMGMAGYGDKDRFFDAVAEYFPDPEIQVKSFHAGVEGWNYPLESEQDRFDLAAAVQAVYEQRMVGFMQRVRRESRSQNLVFMGGCALNCSANTKLLGMWENIWIMPNPGDAGSSLGAALAVHNDHVRWKGPYLGHQIGSALPINSTFEKLRDEGVVGVAAGRAEFGPRAFGNRSLLADPRTLEMKEKVNEVKLREQFRPFAPIVLEDYAYDWFDLDRPSPYMQYAVKCKRPNLIPAVVHVDGTSRVQTVNPYQHFELYELLTRWYEHTGVPVLLNTSLNVRDQPLINDLADVEQWKINNPSVSIVTGFCRE
jgi:carbamoyltransferase